MEMNRFRNLRDMQKVLLRFRSVRFFRLRGIRRNVLPKFLDASHVGVPLRNTDIAAGN